MIQSFALALCLTLAPSPAPQEGHAKMIRPRSDLRQTFRGVTMDRHVRIVEGKDRLEELELASFRLGS